MKERILELGLLFKEAVKRSVPPTFDYDRARGAMQCIDGNFGNRIRGLDALKLALVLSVYNQNDPKISKKLSPLIDEELREGQRNILPTIGIEVESPRRTTVQYLAHEYGVFFDFVGMPRNKINKYGNSDFPMWEFSPPPSYSADVQARVLAGLIKGRFIPSLTFSKKPKDIMYLLDEKGVSLHVNLGLPKSLNWLHNKWLQKLGREPRPDPLQEDLVPEDVDIFASAFALAFSSLQRLDKRQSSDVFMIKKCDNSPLGGREYRLEIKALEVRDESVYRLLREIQLVGAALFGYLEGNNLYPIWKNLRGKIERVFQEFDVNPRWTLKDNKGYLIKVLEKGEKISPRLRLILHEGALEVRKELLKVD